MELPYIKIEREDLVKEILESMKGKIYFLDFECAANSIGWAAKNHVAIDTHISTASFLRVNGFNDEKESQILHVSLLDDLENYEKMATELADFYDGEGAVLVWDASLETKSVAKLIKHAPSYETRLKLCMMLANMVDLQILFHNQSLIPGWGASLDKVARSWGVYDNPIKLSGKKVKFMIQAVIEGKADEGLIRNMKRRIEIYNNSDVLHIKRILFIIAKLIGVK